MKNSKLKVSEYMQNISRSKNFGKFVLIVYLNGVFEKKNASYQFVIQFIRIRKTIHSFTLDSSLNRKGILLTQIYWPKFKQTFKSTLNCIMTTVIGKHFTVLMFMHIFVKKWRGLKDFFQIPF